MDNAMTTTSFGIEGFRVTRNLGVVRGITVRSRSIFGSIGASIQTLFGGNITLMTELCEKTRGDALSKRFEEALKQARQEPVTKPMRDFDLD